jgi:hypothetical protein
MKPIGFPCDLVRQVRGIYRPRYTKGLKILARKANKGARRRNKQATQSDCLNYLK